MPLFKRLLNALLKHTSTLRFNLFWLKALNPLSTRFERCFLCKQTNEINSNHNNGLCEYCTKLIQHDQPLCLQCGLPLSANVISSNVNSSSADPLPGCQACEVSPPIVERTISGLPYRFPVDTMVTHLKFHAQFHFLKPLTHALIQAIQQHYAREDLPDYLVPIPLHPTKLRKRGFNQSLLICKTLSQHLSIPIADILIRTKNTDTQIKLDAKKRQANLVSAFTHHLDHTLIQQRVHHKRIAIVDDVITTGATVATAASYLLSYQPKHIDAWCLARAL